MYNIQALFNSQEIVPSSVLDELESIYGPMLLSPRLGLIEFFNTARDDLKPLVVYKDFSKGKNKTTCLLGKGVLYDCGGYNLKKDSSDMHKDRYGALTALNIAKKLKLPVAIFLAVNLINDKSTLPGTILRSLNYKKVRIVDTDAEGRIGLAHLIEVFREYKNLISFATLTGHSVYSVGSGHAEVFSKDNNLLSEIQKLNLNKVATGRYFKDYEKALDNNGILENLNKNYKEAGAAKAYAFLCRFLQKQQTLLHFDIAGLMDHKEKDYAYADDEFIKILKLIV